MEIGIHGRNDGEWPEIDFETIKYVGFTAIKVLSTISTETIKRLKRENPKMKIIVRLYSGGFGTNPEHPPYTAYVNLVSPDVARLIEFTNLFQVHNEPNHPKGHEGWGDRPDDAADFRMWYLYVIYHLRNRFDQDGIKLIFPGLAVPHNDLPWLEYCQTAIDHSDALGVHDYWQNPTLTEKNHLNPAWGQKHTLYHQRFPDKDIYILEAGNSNRQAQPVPYPLPEGDMAQELVDWYTQVAKSPYVKAACPFLLSSPDPTWTRDGFTWIDGARPKAVVNRVARLAAANLPF